MSYKMELAEKRVTMLFPIMKKS